MGYAGAIVGGLMQLGSAFTGARAARQRRNQLEGIAATPGLDTGAITSEALGAQETAFGPASALTDKINRFNTDQRQGLLDDSIPGYTARKQQSSDLIDAMLRGDVPQDLQDALWNSNAGQALSKGVQGSPFSLYGGAKKFFDKSYERMLQGLQESSRFNRETAGLEMPDVVSIAQYLGLSPQELMSVRGGERSERMRWQAAAAGAPQGSEVWAKYMNDVGGTIGGMGLSEIMSRPSFTPSDPRVMGE